LAKSCTDPSQKAGLAQHDENCGTKGSNPSPSSGESITNSAGLADADRPNRRSVELLRSRSRQAPDAACRGTTVSKKPASESKRLLRRDWRVGYARRRPWRRKSLTGCRRRESRRKGRSEYWRVRGRSAPG